MVSPTCTKRSGFRACIARYDVSPPRDLSIPHPWPQVSPDQITDCAAAWIGAVRKCTFSRVDSVPSAEANQIVASYSRPGASPCSCSRAVWSARASVQGPRIVRSRRPLLPSWICIRPSRAARDHSTAELVVTSPVRAAEVSRSRSRTKLGAPMRPRTPGMPPAATPATKVVRRPTRGGSRSTSWTTLEGSRARLTDHPRLGVVSPNAGLLRCHLGGILMPPSRRTTSPFMYELVRHSITMLASSSAVPRRLGKSTF